MRIASGPAAAFMQLISEPISFQRIFLTLMAAGIAVLYLTAHVMDAEPVAFMHAVFGVSEVIWIDWQILFEFSVYG